LPQGKKTGAVGEGQKNESLFYRGAEDTHRKYTSEKEKNVTEKDKEGKITENRASETQSEELSVRRETGAEHLWVVLQSEKGGSGYN